MGITRAHQRLHVSHAWRRQLFGTTSYNPPSRFFDEIPTALVESAGMTQSRTYGRSSYRTRDDAPPPPYRRRSVSTFSPEDVERHKERIVEVAMAAGKRAPTQSNAQELGLRIGDDVEHPSFGEGVIIDIKGTGEKAEATVRFPGAGTKHLALAWAPLRKLGD